MAHALTAAAPARALLSGLVDYAGLFPPAGLGMEQAVAAYDAYRGAPESWMLGRFVVPAARLDELEAAPSFRASVSGRGPGHAPSRLTALVGPALESHAQAAVAFNSRHPGRAVIESLEVAASTRAQLEQSLAVLPSGLDVFVELPLDGTAPDLLPLLRARHARAKVRTGGITPDAIPEPPALARFIAACAEAGVPFKATAGLHHALRAEHALTYAPDSPRATMHGFLNVFVAAVLARRGICGSELEAVLCEPRAEAFEFDDDGLRWRGRRLDAGELAATRGGFALSFGSCSFEEPVADARALGLIA